MNKNEFLLKHDDILKRYADEIVEGNLNNREDLNSVDFNGVYVIYNTENEILYIGSAYTTSFTIKKRLKGHLYGHESNATLVNDLMNKHSWDRTTAKNYVSNCSFIAIKHLPLEYYLIENTEGLLNKKGYNV